MSTLLPSDQIVYHRPVDGLDYRMDNMQDLVDFLSPVFGSNIDFADNGDGTYTIFNTTKSITIDTNANSIAIQDTAGNFVATNVEDALAELANLVGSAIVVSSDADNDISVGTDGGAFFEETVTSFSLLNGVLTYDDEEGNTTPVAWIPRLIDNNDGTFTWDDRQGNTLVIRTATTADAITYENTASGMFAGNVQDAIDELDSRIDNITGNTHVPATINSPTNTITIAASGTDGQTFDVDVDPFTLLTNIANNPAMMAVFHNLIETTTTLTYDSLNSSLVYTNEDGVVSTINLSSLTTDIHVNRGTLTGTTLVLEDTDGTTPDIIIDFSDFLSTFTNNGDGTYTHDDGQGNTTLLSFQARDIVYDNSTSGLTAIDVRDAIDELAAKSHNPAQLISADGSVSITVAGLDNQVFDLRVDVTADEIPYDNSTSGLTAIDVRDAIDELAASITTLQNEQDIYVQSITSVRYISDTANTVVTLNMSDGTTRTFITEDESVATSSGVVDARLNGNNLEIETADGTIYSVDLSSVDTNTTNNQLQIIGNNLVLTDSDGNTVQVDITSLQTGTTNTSLALLGNNLVLTDSDGNTVQVDLSQFAVDTNTTNTTFGVNGTNLEITDSDGNTLSTDLQPLIDSLDDNVEVISGSVNGSNEIVLTKSDGSTVTIDANSLVTGGAVTFSSMVLDVPNQELDITFSDGSTQSVDVSALFAGTDTDQFISAFTNTGSLLQITRSDIAGSPTTTFTIDLAPIVSTLDSANGVDTVILSGTDLILTLDDGTTRTVDLSSLNVTNQSMTIAAGNILTLTDSAGNTVTTDLSGYLDDTDVSAVAVSIDVSDVLTVSVTEDGNTVSDTVDLSGLNVTNQTLTLNGSNVLVLTDSDGNSVQADLSVLAGGTGGADTDISAVAISVDGSDVVTVSVTEDGTTLSDTVDLAYLNRENQTMTFSNTTNVVTLTDTQGDSVTVDLSDLDRRNQTATYNSSNGQVTITDNKGDSVTVDLSDLDRQNQSFSLSAANILTLTDSLGDIVTVDLSSLAGGGTDTNVSAVSATLSGANILTVSVTEDGNTVSDTVDLSSLASDNNTTNSSLSASLSGTNILTVSVTDSDLNTVTDTVDLSSLAGGGTDTNVSNVDIAIDSSNQVLLQVTEDGTTLTDTMDLDFLDVTNSTLVLDNMNILTLTDSKGNTVVEDLSSLSGAAMRNPDGSFMVGGTTIPIWEDRVDAGSLVSTDYGLGRLVNKPTNTISDPADITSSAALTAGVTYASMRSHFTNGAFYQNDDDGVLNGNGQLGFQYYMTSSTLDAILNNGSYFEQSYNNGAIFNLPNGRKTGQIMRIKTLANSFGECIFRFSQAWEGRARNSNHVIAKAGFGTAPNDIICRDGEIHELIWNGSTWIVVNLNPELYWGQHAHEWASGGFGEVHFTVNLENTSRRVPYKMLFDSTTSTTIREDPNRNNEVNNWTVTFGRSSLSATATLFDYEVMNYRPLNDVDGVGVAWDHPTITSNTSSQIDFDCHISYFKFDFGAMGFGITSY